MNNLKLRMSNQFAKIECTCQSKEVLPGRHERTYTAKWRGSRHLPILITHEAMKAIRDTQMLLPWPLKLIEYDSGTGAGLYGRVDGFCCLTWAAYWLRSHITKAYRYCLVRVVLTLMVWGSAYCAENEQITWKCVGKKRP